MAIRPYRTDDQSLLARVAPRMHPGQTASPRDPETLDRFFAELGEGTFLTKPGARAFVATLDGQPCGLISFYPDTDYFTDHPRAYVDSLAVAQESEGKGVGRALLDYVERWARDRGYREVVLDVFAGNGERSRSTSGRGTGPITSGWQNHSTSRRIGVPAARCPGLCHSRAACYSFPAGSTHAR